MNEPTLKGVGLAMGSEKKIEDLGTSFEK